MRILVVSNKDRLYRTDLNAFVSVFAEGLIKFGHSVNVDNGRELAEHYKNYNLVFFQFPMETGLDLKELTMVLNKSHQAGVKSAITCHDLEPLNPNEEGKRIYNCLYDNVDIIHHMGGYSYKILCEKYQSKRHFIANHPIYYDIQSMGYTKEECRIKLGLPLDKRIVLAFGQFRNDDEVKLFLNIRKSVSSDVLLFAQRIDTGRLNNGLRLDKTFKCLRKRALLHHRNLKYGKDRCKDKMIPYYFSAADVVFLQRKNILNSGNLPMAFSAAKPVVGPNIGNVGPLLIETGNYLFDPCDEQSVSDAVNHALENSIVGDSNHDYAMRKMSPEHVFGIIDKNIREL